MEWIDFSDKQPPVDTPVLVYYKNGALDTGFIVAVRNSLVGWKLERDKTYCMLKWCLIDVPKDD